MLSKFVIVSPLLILTFFKISDELQLKSVCLWTAITGHKCPGCGMTHAIVALLSGNFTEALQLNSKVIIVLPLLCLVWGKYAYNYLKIEKRNNFK